MVHSKCVKRDKRAYEKQPFFVAEDNSRKHEKVKTAKDFLKAVIENRISETNASKKKENCSFQL